MKTSPASSSLVLAPAESIDARLCSVVIPLYNKADYVVAAIESACRQTHRALQIIVIDDGSSDDSPRRARSIVDPRVRIFSQANAGVSAARNRAIERCEGEFVFFLDADDRWHPQFVSCALAVFDAYPRCLLVGADSEWMSADRVDERRFEPLQSVTVSEVADFATSWLASGRQAFCTSTTAVRRSALASFDPPFPEGDANGEDLDLWIRINCESPFALIREPMAYVRADTANSLTSRNTVSLETPSYIRMMQRRVDDGAVPPSLNVAWRVFIAHYYFGLALHLGTLGRRREGLGILLAHPGDARLGRWWGVLALLLVPATLRQWLRRGWAAFRR